MTGAGAFLHMENVDADGTATKDENVDEALQKVMVHPTKGDDILLAEGP